MSISDDPINQAILRMFENFFRIVRHVCMSRKIVFGYKATLFYFNVLQYCIAPRDNKFKGIKVVLIAG